MNKTQIDMIRAIIDNPEMQVETLFYELLTTEEALENIINDIEVRFECPFKVGDKVVHKSGETYTVKKIINGAMNPSPEIHMSHSGPNPIAMTFVSALQNVRKISTISMKEMVPWQMGTVRFSTKYADYNNVFVMRTADGNRFEVLNLSNPRVGGCWGKTCTLDVEPAPNSKFLLETDSNGVVISCTKQS